MSTRRARVLTGLLCLTLGLSPAAASSLDQLAGVEPQAEAGRGAWREGFDEARRLMRFGQSPRALELLVEAYRNGAPRDEVDRTLAEALVRSERPEEARFHAARAMRTLGDEPGVHLVPGQAATLMGEAQVAIDTYEKALRRFPDDGELHFRLALAYDAIDNSPKVLEHAQKAIRIDPEYKAKLKPRIKESNVSRKIGRIVSKVLEDSKYERLTDERIEAYADEIGRILGEEDLPPPPTGRARLRKLRETFARMRRGREEALRERAGTGRASPFVPEPEAESEPGEASEALADEVLADEVLADEVLADEVPGDEEPVDDAGWLGATSR